MTARPAFMVAGALVATLVLATSSAALGSTALGPSTTLSNAVVHNLALATQTGVVPASQTVTVGIYLTNPNQSAEDAYVKQLYNPSSSNYGNFLDPDTFNTEFGVPASRDDCPITWPIFNPPPASSSGARPPQWSRPPLPLIFGVRPISPHTTSRIFSLRPRASTSSMNADSAWSSGRPM